MDPEAFAIIKAANRKIKLIDVLRQYNLKIEKNPIRKEWSQNIRCPFPNHKGGQEKTPSFAYNFSKDYFSCFGCGQAGKAVEFLSICTNTSRIVVAENILNRYSIDVSIEQEEYVDEITPILVDGSKFLQQKIQQYKNNPQKIQQIEQLMWWIDYYLMCKTPGRNVIPDELQLRINRMKELI